jgi:hypothetical protein
MKPFVEPPWPTTKPKKRIKQGIHPRAAVQTTTDVIDETVFVSILTNGDGQPTATVAIQSNVAPQITDQPIIGNAPPAAGPIIPAPTPTGNPAPNVLPDVGPVPVPGPAVVPQPSPAQSPLSSAPAAAPAPAPSQPSSKILPAVTDSNAASSSSGCFVCLIPERLQSLPFYVFLVSEIDTKIGCFRSVSSYAYS